MIIAVKYIKDDGEIMEREYTYLCEIDVSVGDIITVPVRTHTTKAMVSRLNVSEEEVASFRDKLKVITERLPEIKFNAEEE